MEEDELEPVWEFDPREDEQLYSSMREAGVRVTSFFFWND